MTSRTMHVPFREVNDAARSLADELLQCGVTVLDPAQCEAHKRAELSRYRTGAWQYCWPFARVFHFSETMSIITLVAGVLLLIAAVGASLVTVTLAVLSALGFEPWFAPATGLGVTLVLTIVTLAIFFFANHPGAQMAGSARWMRTKLKLERVPTRLHERAIQASLVPGVRLYEERFGVDPLVVALRQRSWWRAPERAYIGAYNTGTPLDAV